MGAFRDVSNSTMERAGPLSPAMIDQIRHEAEAMADALIGQRIKSLMDVMAARGMPISEAEAREILINRSAVVQPETAGKPPPVVPPVTPLPEPNSPSGPIHRGAKTAAAPGKTTKNKRSYVPKSLMITKVRQFIKSTGDSPADFDDFMELWDAAVAESGYRHGWLIRVDPVTGKLRNPANVAIALRAWDTRRKALGQPPKERTVVTPQEQLRRTNRGKRATETKIRKAMELGLSREHALRGLIDHASKQKRRQENLVGSDSNQAAA